MKTTQFTMDDDNAAINEKIAAIISEIPGNDAPEIALCKKSEGKKKYPQIDKLSDYDTENPIDTHEIGIKYGAGDYRAYIYLKDEDGKTTPKQVNFSLGEHYNKLHKDYLIETGQASGMLPSQIQNNNDNSIITLMMQQSQQNMQLMVTMMQNAQNQMTSLLGTILPLMVNKNENSNTSFMERLVIENLKNNNNSANIMFENMTDAYNKGLTMGEKMTKEDDKIDWTSIITTAIEHAPTILKIPKIALPAMMNATPEARQIVDQIDTNPEFFSQMVKTFIDENGLDWTINYLTHTGYLQKAKDANLIPEG